MTSNQPGNGFTIINNLIFEDENLSVIERHALLVLIRFYRSDVGYSYPSYSSLKRYFKVKDNSSVASTLKALEIKGYITRQATPGKGTRYFINKHIYSNEDNRKDTVVNLTGWKKTTSSNNTTSCEKATVLVGKKQHDQLYKSNTINTNTNTKINTFFICQKVIDLYHEVCPDLPKMLKLTDKREKAIKKLMKDMTPDDIRQGFIAINESNFCKGLNDNGWKATFDFCIKPDSIIKALEGKYSNKGGKDRNGSDGTSKCGDGNANGNESGYIPNSGFRR
jgi:hypothetical protein